MKDTIFFSVVIPCHNASEFIEKALVSVCEQTYRHFELVISDDGSSDDTVAVVTAVLQRYDVVYQILENRHQQGPGGTRNAGISKANHEWIAFLDSDDYWAKDKLEQVKNIVESDKQVNYIFHNEIYFDGNSEWPVDYAERYDASVHPFLALVRGNFLSPTSAVVHKSLFDKAGLFDTSLLSAQDYDLWLRMSLLPEFKLYALNQYLAYYWWLRPGCITSDVSLRLESLLKIYGKFYHDIKRISPRPVRELMRFKGRIYSGSGLGFWRHQKFKLGLWYILLGQCYWFRTDWIRKALK